MKPLTEAQYISIKGWLQKTVGSLDAFVDAIQGFEETFGHPFRFAPDDEPKRLNLSIGGEVIAQTEGFTYITSDTSGKAREGDEDDDLRRQITQAITNAYQYNFDGVISEPAINLEKAVDNIVEVIRFKVLARILK